MSIMGNIKEGSRVRIYLTEAVLQRKTSVLTGKFLGYDSEVINIQLDEDYGEKEPVIITRSNTILTVPIKENDKEDIRDLHEVIPKKTSSAS